MDYEEGLKTLLGGGFAELKEAVRKGAIEDHHLERMANHRNMDVKTVYNEERTKGKVEFTMDHMLEKWYKDKLFAMTPKDSQQRLIDVLKDSRVPLMNVEQIKRGFPPVCLS